MSKKLQTNLSNKQKHTLDYWQMATQEIENTCLSVLHLLYQNDDYENYLKYQRQFCNFKDVRKVLSGIVSKTVETNNLFLMESMVLDAVRQLMNMISLKTSVNHSFIAQSQGFDRTVNRLYNEIAVIIVECMSMLKNKLEEIGWLSNNHIVVKTEK